MVEMFSLYFDSTYSEYASSTTRRTSSGKNSNKLIISSVETIVPVGLLGFARKTTLVAFVMLDLKEERS